MASSAAADKAIKHVTVIGGGLMGSGIAQVSLMKLMNMHEYRFGFVESVK